MPVQQKSKGTKPSQTTSGAGSKPSQAAQENKQRRELEATTQAKTPSAMQQRQNLKQMKQPKQLFRLKQGSHISGGDLDRSVDPPIVTPIQMVRAKDEWPIVEDVTDLAARFPEKYEYYRGPLPSRNPMTGKYEDPAPPPPPDNWDYADAMAMEALPPDQMLERAEEMEARAQEMRKAAKQAQKDAKQAQKQQQQQQQEEEDPEAASAPEEEEDTEAASDTEEEATMEEEAAPEEETMEEEEDLYGMTAKELQALAKEEGVKVSKTAKKEDIITAIEEARAESEDEE